MGAEIRMRKILLVEDDPQDVELTLAALDEYHLVSRVVVVGDFRIEPSIPSAEHSKSVHNISQSGIWGDILFQ